MQIAKNANCSAPDLAWLDAYAAIPFAERGSDHRGCHCWGLIALIYRERLGIALPDYAGIGPDDAARLKAIAKGADSPEWLRLMPGAEAAYDVVVMSGIVDGDGGRKASRPIHVGLVAAPPRLVHIERGTGVTVADYRRAMAIRHRVLGFYRYIGDGGRAA